MSRFLLRRGAPIVCGVSMAIAVIIKSEDLGFVALGFMIGSLFESVVILNYMRSRN